MPSLRLVVVLGLICLGACKKDAPAELSPEAKRKQQCNQFAEQTAQTAMLAGQALVAAIDDEPASAKAGRREMKAEADALRQEIYDKCLAWPDEVMKCLGPMGMLEDGCEQRVIAAMDGATVLPEEIPAGPKPAWTFTFESEPRALRVADDGTVVAIAGVESDGLVALREGKVVWRREGDHARWMLPLPGTPATWAVAEENRVVGFDPGTGTVRWTAALPPPGDADGGWPTGVRTAAISGEDLLVADARARFFTVSPKHCATPDDAECVVAQGQLRDEELDSSARLFVDAAGRRYLWEDDELRAFAPNLQRQWTVGAHDGLGRVMLAGARLLLLIDNDVVVLDPKECGSGATIAPSGWPQPGALVMTESECEGCVDAPASCRLWRVYVPESSYDVPARLDDGTLVVNGEEYAHAIHEGKIRWKIALGSGPLVAEGSRVFGLSGGMGEQRAPTIYEADPATGLPKWKTTTDQKTEVLLSSEDAQLAQGGGWLAASVEQTLVVLKIPAA